MIPTGFSEQLQVVVGLVLCPYLNSYVLCSTSTRRLADRPQQTHPLTSYISSLI